MDFFCGSGTTLIACEKLGRKWVGIDKSPKAIEVVKKRLSKISNLYSPNIAPSEVKNLSFFIQISDEELEIFFFKKKFTNPLFFCSFLLFFEPLCKFFVNFFLDRLKNLGFNLD